MPSTIVDATSLPLRVVREGAVSLERLREVVPVLLDIDGNAGEPEESAEPAATTEPEKLPEPEAAGVPDAAADELSESGEQEPGEKTPSGPAGEKAPDAE